MGNLEQPSTRLSGISHIDRIPFEISREICKNVEFASLKNLRLVSKAFSALASEQVFETFYLGLFYESLNKADRVAKHPILRHHVKNLVFCCELLPLEIGEEEWREMIDLRPRVFMGDCGPVVTPALFNHHSPSDDQSWQFFDRTGEKISFNTFKALPKYLNSEVELQKAYGHFEKLCKEQRVLLKDGVTKELRQILRGLSNLHKATISRAPPSSRPPIWMNLRNKILVTPEEWDLRSDGSADYGQEQLSSLLEAAALEGVKIKELDFLVECSPFFSQTLTERFLDEPRNISAARLDQMPGAFEHLRHLTFVIMYGFDSAQKDAAQKFASFIACSRSLQSLSMVLSGRHLGSHRVRAKEILEIDFLHYLRDLHFPKLSFLHLENAVTTEETLTDFLSKHAKTLRTLQLDDVSLQPDHGSWESVVRGMRDSLTLKHLSLLNLYEMETYDEPYSGERAMVNWGKIGMSYRSNIADWIMGGEEPLIWDLDQWDHLHPNEPSRPGDSDEGDATDTPSSDETDEESDSDSASVTVLEAELFRFLQWMRA